MNPPSRADTQERHDTLLHGEKQLENGHRDDPETARTQILILSKCVRVILIRLDEILTPSKPHPINFPTALTICALLLTLLQIVRITQGDTP